MASVVTFFRNTPAPTLKAYFDITGIALPAYVAWDADEPDLVRPLLRAVDEMDAAARKQYDLSVLLQPCKFQSDQEDRIASVELRLLRLMPIETTGQRITLECVNEPDATIWSMAEERLKGESLASGGYVATQAKLVVRFHPEPGARYGRTLPLMITMPHGCNLKDGTEREQLIGEKYIGHLQEP